MNYFWAPNTDYGASYLRGAQNNRAQAEFEERKKAADFLQDLRTKEFNALQGYREQQLSAADALRKVRQNALSQLLQESQPQAPSMQSPAASSEPQAGAALKYPSTQFNPDLNNPNFYGPTPRAEMPEEKDAETYPYLPKGFSKDTADQMVPRLRRQYELTQGYRFDSKNPNVFEDATPDQIKQDAKEYRAWVDSQPENRRLVLEERWKNGYNHSGKSVDDFLDKSENGFVPGETTPMQGTSSSVPASDSLRISPSAALSIAQQKESPTKNPAVSPADELRRRNRIIALGTLAGLPASSISAMAKEPAKEKPVLIRPGDILRNSDGTMTTNAPLPKTNWMNDNGVVLSNGVPVFTNLPSKTLSPGSVLMQGTNQIASNPKPLAPPTDKRTDAKYKEKLDERKQIAAQIAKGVSPKMAASLKQQLSDIDGELKDIEQSKGAPSPGSSGKRFKYVDGELVPSE